MASPPQGLTTLLARLAASGADFLLVGGLAAVAQGAPLTTLDVDVVHRREAENVGRLLAFLAGVEGQRVRVVRLEALADLKRGATGPKERLVLAILEDTLRGRR